MNSRYLLLLLIILVGVALPAAAFADNQHQRGSWYIGFGLGGALAAQWEEGGQTVSFGDWLDGYDKDPAVAGNFNVGLTLSPRTLLGVDIIGVSQTGSLNGLDATAEINSLLLVMTHFPISEGPFIRVGGGFSRIAHTVETSSGETTTATSGVGLLGGIGYAFWLGKSFNLTLNLDQAFQWYDDDPAEPDRSQFTILYLGFEWY